MASPVLTLEEAARRALHTVQIARKRRLLLPLQSALYRATAIHFERQGQAMQTALQRRTAALNPDRLASGLRTDIDSLLNPIFDEFRPSLADAMTVLLQSAMHGAVDHRIRDIGVSVVYDLNSPRAYRALREYSLSQVRKIDETTRKSMKALVARCETDGLAYDATAAAIVAKFSDFGIPEAAGTTMNRAEAISGYELSQAYESASDQVTDTINQQVPLQKYWSTEGDDLVSDICWGNEEAGWIANDDVFPSGHPSPLGHPNCRCTALYQPVQELLTKQQRQARAAQQAGQATLPGTEPAAAPATPAAAAGAHAIPVTVAKTKNDAVAYEKDILGIENPDLAQTFPVEASNAIHQQLADLGTKYPDALESMQRLSDIAQGNVLINAKEKELRAAQLEGEGLTPAEAKRQAEQEVGPPNPVNPSNGAYTIHNRPEDEQINGIYLNPDIYNSVDWEKNVLKYQQDGVDSGMFNAISVDARWPVAHEFGHVVQAYLRDNGEDGWVEKEYEKAFGKPDQLAQLLGISTVDPEVADKKLSGYGSTKPGEFFAEAFAEFTLSPNPRPLAKKIGKLVQQHLAAIATAKGSP